MHGPYLRRWPVVPIGHVQALEPSGRPVGGDDLTAPQSPVNVGVVQKRCARDRSDTRVRDIGIHAAAQTQSQAGSERGMQGGAQSRGHDRWPCRGEQSTGRELESGGAGGHRAQQNSRLLEVVALGEPDAPVTDPFGIDRLGDDLGRIRDPAAGDVGAQVVDDRCGVAVCGILWHAHSWFRWRRRQPSRAAVPRSSKAVPKRRNNVRLTSSDW